MKHLTIIRNTILAWLVLASISNGYAGSFTSFFSTRFATLQRFFSFKQNKPQPAPESKTALATPAPKKERPIITVWIHGTSKRSLLGLLKKEGPFGLFKATTVTDSIKSKKAALTLAHENAAMFPAQSFYLFRWSGKLDYKERERAAQHLHQELSLIVEEYTRTHGIEPFVRVIAHSHGGNVALNLANARPTGPHFNVDELILLACPVQNTTAHLSQNPLFKKVYALHSHGDLIQVLAPQSNGFSERYFPQHKNVIQAAVKIEGKAPGHFDFVTPQFLHHLPHLLAQMTQQVIHEDQKIGLNV